MSGLKKADYFDWKIVQDDRGRILGKAQSRSSMLAEDVRIVRDFLCEIQKGHLEDMPKNENEKTEKCNMVFLAGEIKSVKVRDDHSAFVLVDPTGDTKYIPCTVHDNSELARSLGRFQDGDLIKLHGFVRAWSQKKDGQWTNHVEVRITAIKNSPPERKASNGGGSGDWGDDKGLPF